MADYSGAIEAIKACEGKKRRAYRKCLKTVRRASKHINRTERKVNKWDALEVGYQNGIDGRASIGAAVSDSIGSVANAAASIYGGKAEQQGKTDRTNSIVGGFGANIGTIATVMGVLVAIASLLKPSR